MAYKKYVCIICDFIYDEEKGLPDAGLAPGTRWEDVPDDWVCPDCGVGKTEFKLVEETYKKYICIICDFIYDEEKGLPDAGLAPGTRWEDVPADWVCPDCSVGKTEFQLVEEEPESKSETTSSIPPITIIGTGLAGYTVARELRKLDKESPLRIISADDGGFYSKPSLSNAFLEKKTLESLVITPVTEMATQLNAEILTHTQITKLDSQQHAIYAGDKRLEYSKLVLALGAEPIRLTFAGDAADKVLSVNNLDDYARFRAALEGAKRVTIMGAGLIGCEFANDLQPAGFSVNLIDPGKYPLGRMLPDEVGQVLQQALQDLGINLYFEKAVKRVDSAESGYRLTLTDDSVLETDVVLSAIGLRPHTELAANCGLAVERGIVVDRYLKTSAEDIYAVGDCMQIEGLVLPFIMPLMNAARVVAKNLTGQPTTVNYPAMPVTVKTPACPMVISKPAASLAGEWEIEKEGQDVRALFYTPERKLGGFILMGAKVASSPALAKQLPPLLA